MDHGQPTNRPGAVRRSFRFRAVLIVVAAMSSSFAVAGCTHAPGDPAMATMQAPVATQQAATMATPQAATVATPTAPSAGASANAAGGAQGMAMMPTDASAAWAARPAFTRVSAETEAAYAYALYNPQFIAYIPCYCGCAQMGHRSNLDCYLKKAMPGKPTAFEEHASYCDICVQTTLTVKQLIAQGKTLREIRQVIDQTFGGGAPGTPTQLPPA